MEAEAEYRYDSLGRRVSKTVEYRGGAKREKRFLWQGLRMLQEKTPEQSQLYLYEPGRSRNHPAQVYDQALSWIPNA